MGDGSEDDAVHLRDAIQNLGRQRRPLGLQRGEPDVPGLKLQVDRQSAENLERGVGDFRPDAIARQHENLHDSPLCIMWFQNAISGADDRLQRSCGAIFRPQSTTATLRPR